MAAFLKSVLFCLCRDDVGQLYLLERSGEAADFLFREFHDAVGYGEEGVVTAFAHVQSRTDGRAALADDDVAYMGELAGVELGAQALTLGIADITSTAASFLMCHKFGLVGLSADARGRASVQR